SPCLRPNPNPTCPCPSYHCENLLAVPRHKRELLPSRSVHRPTPHQPRPETRNRYTRLALESRCSHYKNRNSCDLLFRTARPLPDRQNTPGLVRARCPSIRIRPTYIRSSCRTRSRVCRRFGGVLRLDRRFPYRKKVWTSFFRSRIWATETP